MDIGIKTKMCFFLSLIFFYIFVIIDVGVALPIMYVVVFTVVAPQSSG